MNYTKQKVLLKTPFLSLSSLIKHSGIMLISLLILSTHTSAIANEALLTLESATSQAVRDNPSLAGIKARSEALAAIPSQAGSLADPELSFSALNLPTDTFDLDQEPMTQIQIGFSQAIPFPGKLGLREEVTQFEADAANDNIAEARLRLISQVKISWWTLFYIDRALEIVINNQRLLRQFVKIAETKYEVGSGLQQDVLLAQLELSKLLDEEIILQGHRRNQSAQLNKLLNQPANKLVSLPDKVARKLPAISSEDALYLLAEDKRPVLMQRHNEVQAAQSRVNLAKKDYYPDFKLGAFYGVRSGDNPASVGGKRSDVLSLRMSMSLPIYTARKQDKAVDQRNSELLKQRYSLQDMKNNVQLQISKSVADFLQAKQQVTLFEKGIIPQATQTVASMLAGYQVNEVDFLNLVRSQLTLFNYETRYWKAFTEANQALAKLTAAVGEEKIYE